MKKKDMLETIKNYKAHSKELNAEIRGRNRTIADKNREISQLRSPIGINKPNGNTNTDIERVVTNNYNALNYNQFIEVLWNGDQPKYRRVEDGVIVAYVTYDQYIIVIWERQRG